jgi:phage baseplate assembly protein W
MSDADLAGKEYLGRGWAFPVRWSRESGVATVEAEDAVRQAVLLLLRTGVDERVMRPGFGAGVDRYVFAERTEETQFRLQEDVRRALVRWEPRVIVDLLESVIDDEDSARIDVRVEYRVDPHRRPQSLVFPFYLADAVPAPVVAR